ncbi:MAG: ABC transporter permease [Thermoprotei archaeon]|nr:MAG: ABC transporter permease [Thermoprotei archaeon]
MRGFILSERFKALMWKELTDLVRDKKTIATSLLMPLIVLPLLGITSIALMGVQEVNIAIIDLDNNVSYNPVLNISISSKDLVSLLSNELKKYGYDVVVSHNESIAENGKYDLIIIIPKGFSRNASSTTLRAKITVLRRAGIQAAIRAESLVNSIIDFYSRKLSEIKVNAIVKMTGINATLESLLDPLSTRTVLIGIGGKVVGFEVEFRSYLARILVLALSVVIMPATSFIIDGIIGERERKTIEMLLSSPVNVSLIIYSKLIAASLLGLLTALADAFGLIAYITSISLVYSGAIFFLDPYILLVHAIVAFFTILVTVAIALPFITRTRGIRSASNIASIVAVAGTIMFFTGFIVDYTKLQAPLRTILYFIPYTHSILAIQNYVLGYSFEPLINIMVLALLSIGLILLSVKTLNTEKILLAPPT